LSAYNIPKKHGFPRSTISMSWRSFSPHKDQPRGGFTDFDHFCQDVTQTWNGERSHGMAKMNVDIDGAYAGGNENVECL